MLTPSRTALILLAAGASRRFEGGAKLLQPFRGRLLIDFALDLGRGMDFVQRILVTRAGLSALGERGEGYECVANHRPEAGMGYSLKLAVDALAGRDVDACMVLLADMPFVDTAHLEALFAASAAGLVASEAEGIPQPPALFAARYFPALAAVEGDSGPRDLLRRAVRVQTDPATLADIDTLDDISSVD